MRRTWTARAVLAFALAASTPFATGALAQDYSLRDARYVTTSRNVDVLAYVVCLEVETNKQPRRIAIETALDNAAAACRTEALQLPRDPMEPTAEDLRASILECGFRPGEASPDSGCDARSNGDQASNEDRSSSGGEPPACELYSENAIIAASPRLVRTGTWLEGIALDDGAIWGAEGGQRTVSKIDLDSGRTLATYEVGRLPVDLIFGLDRNVFAITATDRNIMRIDARGKVSTFAKLPGQPVAMIGYGAQMWVLVNQDKDGLSKNNVLVRIDMQTAKQTKSAKLGAGATDIVTLDNQIWVAHAQNGTLARVDANSLRIQTSLIADAEMSGLATDGTSIFAGGENNQGGLIIKVDARRGAELARVVMAEKIVRLATDGQYVVAVGNKTGTMWILSANDLSFLREVRTDTIGALFTASSIILDGSTVYVGVNQFLDANYDYLKDDKGANDQRGGVLVYNDVLPCYGSPIATSLTPPQDTAAPPPLPPRQAQPTAVSAPAPADPASAGFPVWAGSRGGNVRNAPDPNAAKIGSTADGQTIELVGNAGGSYQGYPWFLIRMPDGSQGYLWGGGACSYPSAPRDGTNGFCSGTDAGQAPLGNSASRANPPPLPRQGNGNGAGQQPNAASNEYYPTMPDGSSVPNGLYQSCAIDFGQNTQPYRDCLDRGIASITLENIVSNDPLRDGNYSDIMRQDIEVCMEKGPLGSSPFYACLGHTMAMINQAKAQSGAEGSEPDPAQFGADGEEDDVGLQIGDYCTGRYPDQDARSQCVGVLNQCVDNTTGVDDTQIVAYCGNFTSW